MEDDAPDAFPVGGNHKNIALSQCCAERRSGCSSSQSLPTWNYGTSNLRDQNVPDEIPDVGEFGVGETKVRHPFRTVRLWELDPTPVLSAGDPGLLPWALLMRLGREEAQRLGAEVGKSGNVQWMARFLTLGSLRYDREELKQMLGGPRMGLVEAIVEGSSLFQYERERGEAAGLAKGEAAGLAKEARRLLRLILADRFPGLENLPELDRIVDLADLENLLLQHATRAGDSHSVKQAILEAASRQAQATS